MAKATVVLSEQDLSEFLEDNQAYMTAYADELNRRLIDYFGDAEVVIDGNALSDKIDVDGEPDNGEVAHILNQVVNDWNWLPE
jgi:hypothetical protein